MISSQVFQNRTADMASTVKQAIDLAVMGLPPMFDEKSGLFCYSLKQTATGLVRDGISRRYTIITLLGLNRLEESGRQSPIATASVLDKLLANLDWVDNIGDLGLLLWLTAAMAPERLASIESRLKLGTALTRYADARQGRTMELSWFLAGLCHWALAVPAKAAHLKELTFETYSRVINNQGERGFFRHTSRNSGLSGKLRGWIGSFADQVYPIYALAHFHQAYNNQKAADQALCCAHSLCEAQGLLGQWWWHYDSSRGRVFEGYPVFSVHQHGMGPMTLFALGDATNRNFDSWIYKGLQWINQKNELGFEMSDESAKVIWRCIFQSNLHRYWRAAFHRRRDPIETDRGQLNVLFECRPYELGWLLYAFAGRNICSSSGHAGPAQSAIGVKGEVGITG